MERPCLGNRLGNPILTIRHGQSTRSRGSFVLETLARYLGDGAATATAAARAAGRQPIGKPRRAPPPRWARGAKVLGGGRPLESRPDAAAHGVGPGGAAGEHGPLVAEYHAVQLNTLEGLAHPKDTGVTDTVGEEEQGGSRSRIEETHEADGVGDSPEMRDAGHVQGAQDPAGGGHVHHTGSWHPPSWTHCDTKLEEAALGGAATERETEPGGTGRRGRGKWPRG